MLDSLISYGTEKEVDYCTVRYNDCTTLVWIEDIPVGTVFEYVVMDYETGALRLGDRRFKLGLTVLSETR